MSMFAGGYAGQILYVNLSDGSLQKKSLERDFALKYIGGRGFSSRILWDELEPGIDPFSPANIVSLCGRSIERHAHPFGQSSDRGRKISPDRSAGRREFRRLLGSGVEVCRV